MERLLIKKKFWTAPNLGNVKVNWNRKGKPKKVKNIKSALFLRNAWSEMKNILEQ